MTTTDVVRSVAAELPRAYEVEVRGRTKFRVKQIVFVAFSADAARIGFGYPKAERDGLVASDPDTFFLPPARDLRYPWVCAFVDRLDDDETRELVTDAWRMCVPRMLHDLPELPAPAARLWDLVDRREWADAAELLDPDVVFADRDVALTGRDAVLHHLRDHSTPRPPTDVEVRDGLVVRWERARGPRGGSLG